MPKKKGNGDLYKYYQKGFSDEFPVNGETVSVHGSLILNLNLTFAWNPRLL